MNIFYFFGAIIITIFFIYLFFRAIFLKKYFLILFTAILLLTAIRFESILMLVYYVTLTIFQITAIYIIIYSCLSVIKILTSKPIARKRNNASFKTIAIVIAIHNEEEVIENTIRNLLQLNYPKDFLEIVIIDDGSTDNSRSVLRNFKSCVRVIERNKPDLKGKPSSLNEMIPGLESEIIVTLDADSLPERDYLIKINDAFQDESLSLIQTRNIQYNENSTLISKLVAIDIDVLHFFLYHSKHIINGMRVYEGRGGAFRRSAFLDLNGFNHLLPTEDWDFGFRLQISGKKALYDYNIVNYEQATETTREFVKQRYRWYGSSVQTFFTNIVNVIASKSLSLIKKIDFLFNGLLILWGLSFYLIGFSLTLMHFEFQRELSYFPVYLIIISQIFFNLPAFVKRKKISDLFFFPFFYLYYAFYSLVVIHEIIDVYILKKAKSYYKSNHLKSPLMNYIYENRFN